jgi:hypothetical protein
MQDRSSPRASARALRLFAAATRRAAAQLEDNDLIAVEGLINQLLTNNLLSAEPAKALTSVHYAPVDSLENSVVVARPDVERLTSIWSSPDVGERLASEIAEAALARRQYCVNLDGQVYDTLFVGSPGPRVNPRLLRGIEWLKAMTTSIGCSRSDYHWMSMSMADRLLDRSTALDEPFSDCMSCQTLRLTALHSDLKDDNSFQWTTKRHRSNWGSCYDRYAGQAVSPLLIVYYRRQVDLAPAQGNTAIETGCAPIDNTVLVTDVKVASKITSKALDDTDDERATLERHFEWRMNILRDSLSTPDVGILLGITAQGVRKRLERKELLAIKHVGDYRFPHWQFDANCDNGVVRGLSTVLKVMTIDPISIAAWLTHRQPSLNDRTPMDALKAGDVDAVVAEAEGVGVT